MVLNIKEIVGIPFYLIAEILQHNFCISVWLDFLSYLAFQALLLSI